MYGLDVCQSRSNFYCRQMRKETKNALDYSRAFTIKSLTYGHRYPTLVLILSSEINLDIKWITCTLLESVCRSN